MITIVTRLSIINTAQTAADHRITKYLNLGQRHTISGGHLGLVIATHVTVTVHQLHWSHSDIQPLYNLDYCYYYSIIILYLFYFIFWCSVYHSQGSIKLTIIIITNLLLGIIYNIDQLSFL